MFQVEAAEGRARLQFYLGKAEKETGTGAASQARKRTPGQGWAGALRAGGRGSRRKNKAAKGDLDLAKDCSKGKGGGKVKTGNLESGS